MTNNSENIDIETILGKALAKAVRLAYPSYSGKISEKVQPNKFNRINHEMEDKTDTKDR